MFNFYRGLLLALTLLVPAQGFAQAVPLEDLFKQSEFGNAAISPSGDYLAVTVANGDRRNLAILDISDLTSLKITASFHMRGGESPSSLVWVNNERLLFESVIQAGAVEAPMATGRVYGINADGTNRRQLFGVQAGSFAGRLMNIVSYLPNDPEWILIEQRSFDNERPIAQYMHVDDGRLRRRITSPLGRGGFLADQNDQVRFAYGTDDNMVYQFAWRETEESDWKTFKNTLESDILPISFNPAGNGVYFSSREVGKLGIYEVTLATGEIKPVLPSENVELDLMSTLSPLQWDAQRKNLLAARFMDGKPEWRAINEDTHEMTWLRQLEAMYDGFYVHIFNWTADGKRALVGISGDVSDTEYFLLDTETPELRFMVAARGWLDPNQMRPMQPVQFEARDGTELHGYMTLPAGFDGETAIPFVVFVHGGPHGPRDRWAFDPFVQTFATNGFGVLQVNFRGSGGYGQAFEEAGHREWYGKMQDDVTDATLWAMEQGFAAKDRTCIAGASYGGYATLAGITKEPDLYACAWGFVGVYDLPLMKKEGNVPSFEAGRRYLDRVLGTDEEELIARSPARQVERIKTPLFIVHGAEDLQAHFGQFHFLREQLDKHEIPYEWMFVEGEGHGFYKTENNVAMMERVLEFMKKHTAKQ
ncbi:alpha/beta hydrolase family protein [Aliidiomarina celeris]|uniref:alpha/beta hydrolase family protein n=1 Tax=Aliidiomarina celeris TaxID=2249428 RepID=UPI000DEAAEBE|nr:prolyl oligopeptidase family serine peptidase [Aliidiomarina celeris]